MYRRHETIETFTDGAGITRWSGVIGRLSGNSNTAGEYFNRIPNILRLDLPCDPCTRSWRNFKNSDDVPPRRGERGRGRQSARLVPFQAALSTGSRVSIRRGRPMGTSALIRLLRDQRWRTCEDACLKRESNFHCRCARPLASRERPCSSLSNEIAGQLSGRNFVIILLAFHRYFTPIFNTHNLFSDYYRRNFFFFVVVSCISCWYKHYGRKILHHSYHKKKFNNF